MAIDLTVNTIDAPCF